jgi:hypothetical protein
VSTVYAIVVRKRHESDREAIIRSYGAAFFDTSVERWVPLDYSGEWQSQWRS